MSITTGELARIRAAAVGDMLGDSKALDEMGSAATVFRLCRELELARKCTLPRALEWTNEPPKVPGCYLGRKKGCRISMVIYCFYQKDELGFWNGKKFCTFEQDEAEYFGPIPEPRDGHE